MPNDLENAVDALREAVRALDHAADAIRSQMQPGTKASDLLDTRTQTREIGLRSQELRALARRAESLETEARALLAGA